MVDRIRQVAWLRKFEMAAIVVFMLAAVVALATSSTGQTPSLLPATPDVSINAYAYAMPNNGWAPLTVYFSPYDTSTESNSIVRYEWDLDGNGLFESDATSNQGYASYTYTKARDYTISLRVTSAGGGTATAQTVVSVRHPASSSVDYWSIFDDTRVGRVQVTLDKTDWDQMWVDPIAKIQAHADAVVFGKRLQDVGFRMRGQFSLRNSGDKKPFKIDIDAYIDGQEYKNLRQLMLLNNIGDPSLLMEKLAYEGMAFTGLPASHVSFVELWIDIRDDEQDAIFWGVYSLVERVDNKYIRNRFTADAKEGNLYKASHAQRGPMDLVYYGDDIEDYPVQNGQYAYGKMNNEEKDDYSDITALARTIDGRDYLTEADYIQALEEAINVDAFLRCLAVNAIIDNWDSYINTGNNFYLFNNPVSGRFEWIPWDLTWGGNTQASLITRMDSELMEAGAPMFVKTMAIEKYHRAYLAYIDLLTRYWFTPEKLSPLVNHYHDMIAPYISQSTGDKAFYGSDPMYEQDAFTHSADGLIEFIKGRSAYIASVLQEQLSTIAEQTSEVKNEE